MARRLSPGVAGWLLVAAVVVALDLVAVTSGTETLSAAYARARRHPRFGLLPLLVAAYLAAHLEQRPRWAQRLDPLRASHQRITR